MGSLLPPEIRVASCRNAAAFYEPRNVSLGNSLKSAKYLSKQKEKKAESLGNVARKSRHAVESAGLIGVRHKSRILQFHGSAQESKVGIK